MLRHISTWGIAFVWFFSGMFCKILHWEPRHRQIVARILGDECAPLLTLGIGIGEVLMAIWVVSRILPRLNAWLQIGLVVSMNILEFALAPDLLLFGRLNIVFAALFAGYVYWRGIFSPRQKEQG